MKSSAHVSLAVLVVGSLLAFAGCSDDDAGDDTAAGGASAQGIGGASAGALECEVLGELCHEADTGAGTAHDCHELGHQGNAAACGKAFNGCVASCVVDDDGAGGAATALPDARCAALGELCHEVDDGNGPLHDCHELGHIGNAGKCAAGFDDCATRCLAARAALEPGSGGASGAGGAAASGEAGSAGTADASAGGTAGSGG